MDFRRTLRMNTGWRRSESELRVVNAADVDMLLRATSQRLVVLRGARKPATGQSSDARWAEWVGKREVSMERLIAVCEALTVPTSEVMRAAEREVGREQETFLSVDCDIRVGDVAWRAVGGLVLPESYGTALAQCVGFAVKRLRIAQGMGSTKLAAASGLDYRSLSAIENETSGGRVWALVCACWGLGVAVSEVLTVAQRAVAPYRTTLLHSEGMAELEHRSRRAGRPVLPQLSEAVPRMVATQAAGWILRGTRERRGESTAEVSARAGVVERVVTVVEAGSAPSAGFAAVLAICEALGVAASTVVGAAEDVAFSAGPPLWRIDDDRIEPITWSAIGGQAKAAPGGQPEAIALGCGAALRRLRLLRAEFGYVSGVPEHVTARVERRTGQSSLPVLLRQCWSLGARFAEVVQVAERSGCWGPPSVELRTKVNSTKTVVGRRDLAAGSGTKRPSLTPSVSATVSDSRAEPVTVAPAETRVGLVTATGQVAAAPRAGDTSDASTTEAAVVAVCGDRVAAVLRVTGRVLRAARQGQGLSEAAAGERMGVPAREVRRMEAMRVSFNFNAIVQAWARFGLPAHGVVRAAENEAFRDRAAPWAEGRLDSVTIDWSAFTARDPDGDYATQVRRACAVIISHARISQGLSAKELAARSKVCTQGVREFEAQVRGVRVGWVMMVCWGLEARMSDVLQLAQEQVRSLAPAGALLPAVMAEQVRQHDLAVATPAGGLGDHSEIVAAVLRTIGAAVRREREGRGLSLIEASTTIGIKPWQFLRLEEMRSNGNFAELVEAWTRFGLVPSETVRAAEDEASHSDTAPWIEEATVDVEVNWAGFEDHETSDYGALIGRACGIIVRELREAQGVTREDLAIRSGLRGNSVKSFELNQRQASLGWVMVICWGLRVRMSDVLRIAEEKVGRGEWRPGGVDEPALVCGVQRVAGSGSRDLPAVVGRAG